MLPDIAFCSCFTDFLMKALFNVHRWSVTISLVISAVVLFVTHEFDAET